MRQMTVHTFSLLLLVTSAFAQDTAKKPPLSPPAKAEAKIGEVAVSVDYAAPSRRGRAIMGELVPYGKVWRTGANAATTLRTSSDLMIGSLHVPAGTYTLYTIPGETEWTLIVSKQTGQWGSSYDADQDLGRVKMTTKATGETVETFSIGINSSGARNGALTMAWENIEASVPVTVP